MTTEITGKEIQQVELEKEQINLGVKRYQDTLRKSQEQQRETTMLPQRMLLLEAIPKVSVALRDDIDRVSKKGRKPTAISILEELDTDAVAFVTANEVINSISLGRNCLETELGIARGIFDYILLEEFKTKSPSYYAWAVDKVNHSSNQKYKRNSLKHYAHHSGLLSEKDKRKHLLIGIYLLELFIKETGLVTKEKVHNKGKTHMFLKAKSEVIEWLQQKHNHSEVLSPFYLPMVVPPYQWTNCLDGGYRTRTLPLVKGYNLDYLKKLHENNDLSIVYKAVNAIQDTAWRINDRVLNILNHYVDNNVECRDKVLPPIPYTEAEIKNNLPPMPCEKDDEVIARFKTTNPNEWAEWKQLCASAYTNNERNKSKRASLAKQLWMANKFVDEPKLYFPCQLDFRSRCYPVVPLLNPQTNDLGKGLLEFAYKEEIGEDGDRWLKVHLANSYGIDKESIDDRIKWVEEHEIQILMVAKDPISARTFWEYADSPWQFLATCFEYADYVQSGLGPKFLSSIPVGIDATCSGLQHFSSWLLDAEGGAKVNLVPQEKPADIYSDVAKRVEEKLAVDPNPMALNWKGKVSRKLVKRQCMTLPYGATQFGMRDQLKQELKSQAEEGNHILPEMDKAEEWNHLTYLTAIIWESIKEIVTKPVQAMDWLKEIAKKITESGQVIEWTTPVGFHVTQNYQKKKEVRIDTHFMNLRVQRKLQESIADTINPRKNMSSLSPNVVHSCDASHLMATVNALVNEGVQDFAMVHDSFAVHVGHVTKLATTLREEFVKQYSGQFMEELHRQFEMYSKLELPKPPTCGNLDINAIKESDYFFN